GVAVESLDIPINKLNASARRVTDRAIEESRRCDHALITSGHLLCAFAQTEWDLFAQVMREAELNPHGVLSAVEGHLQRVPLAAGGKRRVCPTTMLVCSTAVYHAGRAGRPAAEASDLLIGLLSETSGAVAAALLKHGADPIELVSRLEVYFRDRDKRQARLQQRFELPPMLKQYGTNLNLLAHLDKLPPVFGRDQEIQQVLEILSHRDRTNSVMLLGEPGVGKTAIAEGLAQRIEFAPATIPIRLRHCQIVSIQLNAIVAGTMLRGMFEDRLENIIREVKEHPNLILFIDEAHTIVGAGSALGGASDAGQIFKGVLARGEIRMIAATTLSEYKQHIEEDEALARRFRCVQVPEPTIDEARRILYDLRPRLERNYSVDLL